MSLCTALPHSTRVCVLLGGTGRPVSSTQPARPLPALLTSRVGVDQPELAPPCSEGSASPAPEARSRRPVLGRRIWRLRRAWRRAATAATAPAALPGSAHLQALSG